MPRPFLSYICAPASPHRLGPPTLGLRRSLHCLAYALSAGLARHSDSERVLSGFTIICVLRFCLRPRTPLVRRVNCFSGIVAVVLIDALRSRTRSRPTDEQLQQLLRAEVLVYDLL